MIEININKLEKNYGFNKLLKNFNLEVKTNEIVALVGSNGCGKSTILNIISGIETPTSGTVAIRKEAKIGYLKQELESYDSTVNDLLYKQFDKVYELEKKLKKLEKNLEDEKILFKYIKLQEDYMRLSGYEIDEKIGKIIKKFNIEHLLDKNYNLLSGGQKKIVELALIMLKEPTILLLDEPTNHLDINQVEWLEDYLKNYNGTVLLISHDRYFLDNVATKIVLIEKGSEEIFIGNYSNYIIENENRIMNEFKQYKDQQKQIAKMKESIKKLREYGRLGDNEIFFKRANSIEKRLEKMEKFDKPVVNKSIPLNVNNDLKSSNEVIKIENLTIPNLYDNINILIRRREHVCLMGENGSGKTTLINYILNNNCMGPNVKYGYIEQVINFQDENKTVLEETRKYYNGDESHLRSALCKFLFYGENVFKKIKSLSGGEKVRLKLFCLMQSECNLLIFDEPTNHIDTYTREVLEEALKNYNGTLLFISHDRYFINKVAEKILYIKNKKIIESIGNFDDLKNNI